MSLSSTGHTGTVFCLDGSPDFLFAMLSLTVGMKSDQSLQNNLICHTIDIIVPNNDVTPMLSEKLEEIESYEERVQLAIKLCPVQTSYTPKFIGAIAVASFDRLKMIVNNKITEKIKAPVILLRPKENPPFLVLEDNYGLDKLTDGPITVHLLEGNHVTILENKDCANIINKVLAGHNTESKTSANVVSSMVEKERSIKA